MNKLANGTDSELQAKLADQIATVTIPVEQSLKEQEREKRKDEEELRECEEKWKKWAEKEA